MWSLTLAVFRILHPAYFYKLDSNVVSSEVLILLNLCETL